jgi:hypothetical protein
MKLISAIKKVDSKIQVLYDKLIFIKNAFYVNYVPGGWAIGWDDALVLVREISRFE